MSCSEESKKPIYEKRVYELITPVGKPMEDRLVTGPLEIEGVRVWLERISTSTNPVEYLPCYLYDIVIESHKGQARIPYWDLNINYGQYPEYYPDRKESLEYVLDMAIQYIDYPDKSKFLERFEEEFPPDMIEVLFEERRATAQQLENIGLRKAEIMTLQDRLAELEGKQKKR